MMRARLIGGGLVLMAAVGWPTGLAADVIHLVNGSALEVEAWRDLGDIIEFASGGGIVQIAKIEVRKIDGKPRRGDLPMYSSGTGAGAASPTSAAAPVDRAAAVKQLTEILTDGEALFGQPFLSGVEKAGAFRRLAERWRGLEVPDALRDVHRKGEEAIQAAVDAFVAEGALPGDAAPDARQRTEKAKADFRSLQDEIKKAGAGKQG
jgi:hypothetical protein